MTTNQRYWLSLGIKLGISLLTVWPQARHWTGKHRKTPPPQPNANSEAERFQLVFQDSHGQTLGIYPCRAPLVTAYHVNEQALAALVRQHDASSVLIRYQQPLPTLDNTLTKHRLLMLLIAAFDAMQLPVTTQAHRASTTLPS